MGRAWGLSMDGHRTWPPYRREGGMTSMAGGSQPRDRPDERRRRAIEAALLAFRPVMRQELRRPIGWETPGRDRAVEDLAGTNLHRVLKHRFLIHAIRRSRQDDQEALDQP